MDGIRKLWRALFPPPGEFTCIICGETFPERVRKVRTVAIDAGRAAELEEPEAEGQVDILEFCPGCFEKTKNDFGGF